MNLGSFPPSNRTNLAYLQHPSLSIYEGDVWDAEAVRNAMSGHNAVICVLGAGRKGRVRAEGTRTILAAMEATGVHRLICQTTLGAGESRGNLNFFWKHIMFGWLLKEAIKDHQLQETYVQNSNVDWTLVRPGAFTNGNPTGRYQHGFDSRYRSLRLKISCADLAAFMLAQLESEQYRRKATGISY